MTISALESGLRGIQIGISNAAKHAEEVTRAFLPSGDGDPVDSLIGLALDTYQVRASAKVISTERDLQQSVLDILA